jgi:hypothetical protein
MAATPCRAAGYSPSKLACPVFFRQGEIMDYDLKMKFLSVISELRADLDKAGEHLTDGNLIMANNAIRDVEQDCSALQSILRIERRHCRAKAPESPAEKCPL